MFHGIPHFGKTQPKDPTARLRQVCGPYVHVGKPGISNVVGWEVPYKSRIRGKKHSNVFFLLEIALEREREIEIWSHTLKSTIKGCFESFVYQ